MREKTWVADKILKVLKKHKDGVTIKELSEMVKVSRITLAKYLVILETQKKIKIRNVGPSKLVYPK